jgi:hypothetical protein
VTPRDPNLAKVELLASVLGPLRERVVFVGGCAVGLLITDPGASPVRVTFDIDLVASISALAAYHGMERELARLGFKRDLSPDAPICRWRYRELEVDLMPADPHILGFSNRWYPLALTTATDFRLPSGSEIRLIAAPVFIGTKFEAYADRGGGDLLASHDLEDIINIVDGRTTLLEEIAAAPEDLRMYLRERCAQLLAEPHFADYLPGLIAPGEDLAERAQMVTERLQAIAHMRETH